jgi:hypothetical protein
MSRRNKAVASDFNYFTSTSMSYFAPSAVRVMLSSFLVCLLCSPGCDGVSSSPGKSGPVVYPALKLAEVVDFTKLKRLPDTKGHGGAAFMNLSAPGKVRDVAAFYADQLTKLGWKPAASSGVDDSDEFVSATFERNGHLISLSFFKTGDPSATNVSLISHGNLDSRTLPRSPGSRPLTEAQAYTWYVTPNKVPDETKWVQAALEADGWQAIQRMHSGKGEDRDDQRFLELRKQGYDLNIMIGVAPGQDNQTVVQYAVTALSHELPTPPGATNVEFADDTWELKCTAPGDVKQVGEFYRKAMPAAGYTSLSSEDPHDTYWNLRFGTPDEDIVLVQGASKDGQTHISIHGISAVALKEMKKREQQTPAAGRQ